MSWSWKGYKIPAGKSSTFPHGFSINSPCAAAKLWAENGNKPATFCSGGKTMNSKKLLTIVGVLAILVAALPAGAAFAQGPTGQNPPLGLGRGNWGGPDNSLVAVAAEVLGMEQTALVAELNTGKTIAQVAKAKGVALDKIVTTFAQPHVD